MNPRIKFYMILSLLLMSIMILSACGEDESTNESKNVSADKVEVIELDVNNWTSSTHHYAYNVFEPWKELVEEKTDGRVVVNIFHGSALGKSSTVYQDVSGGLYDVGLIVANYFYDTGFFPYTVGNLPFAFEGPEEAASILQEFGDKYAKDDLTDIVVLGPTATDGYDLFSTKPIKSVADLKGLKMRVNGKSEIAFVQGLGGVPVSLATEDTYEGLQKSTIDTAFYTPIGAVGLKYFEPAPYITKLAVSVTPIIPIINKDFYDSLPADLKTIFDEELNPKLTELITASYETELESSHKELEEFVKERGEFITLSDEELENFRLLGEEAWTAWINDANDKGYPGEEMAQYLFELLEEAGYPIPY
ncbi:TRAP transporter substrate-binding protein [Paenisporosarcina sp. TG20]|uniref:TRAP transporter substrate-binding protein n=1 Tax=Paenisporosarcina sp. TG20 TaxID=1211706 RepID=UPI0002E53F1C|nr:TRAP transporter substrate-binding protein DctP [Paenisporosarcina sp. TG20]